MIKSDIVRRYHLQLIHNDIDAYNVMVTEDVPVD